MIGYEDMLAGDAYNYFHNCWAFRILNDGQRVLSYTLDMGYEDSDELAHDLRYIARDRAGQELEVYGEELFCTNEWITHRFQLGYIPMSANSLVRVDAEPVSSRMCKGLRYDHLQSLPVVVTNGDSERASRVGRRVRGALRAQSVPAAIAKVLSLGTPPVMRPRVPLGEAHTRARQAVRDFMRDATHLVCVPDFKVALVKNRTHDGMAYILNNGAHIGNLYSDGGGDTREPKVWVWLNRPRHETRKVQDYIEGQRMTLARNLLTDDVQWAK